MDEANKSIMLAHAVFNFFSECYSTQDFNSKVEMLSAIITQIINNDVLPVVRSIEENRS